MTRAQASRLVSRPVRGVAALVLLLGFAGAGYGEEIASGLRVGEYADQFLVKDCTGPAAGKTLCYYCRYAERPVVALFIRELNDQVGDLITKVDRVVAKHQSQRLAAFVIYVGKDTPAVEARLKRLAKEARLGHTPLTIYRESPQKLQLLYRIHPKAAITALVWQNRRVQVNQAYPNPRISTSQQDEFIQSIARSLKP